MEPARWPVHKPVTRSMARRSEANGETSSDSADVLPPSSTQQTTATGYSIDGSPGAGDSLMSRASAALETSTIPSSGRPVMSTSLSDAIPEHNVQTPVSSCISSAVVELSSSSTAMGSQVHWVSTTSGARGYVAPQVVENTRPSRQFAPTPGSQSVATQQNLTGIQLSRDHNRFGSSSITRRTNSATMSSEAGGSWLSGSSGPASLGPSSQNLATSSYPG